MGTTIHSTTIRDCRFQAVIVGRALRFGSNIQHDGVVFFGIKGI